MAQGFGASFQARPFFLPATRLVEFMMCEREPRVHLVIL